MWQISALDLSSTYKVLTAFIRTNDDMIKQVGRAGVPISVGTRGISLIAIIQTGSEANTASHSMGTGVLCRVKSGRDVMLITHLLPQRLTMSGAITLLPLCTFTVWTGKFHLSLLAGLFHTTGWWLHLLRRKTEVKAEALYDITHAVSCYSAADRSCS
jgi:hypothetical protein